MLNTSTLELEISYSNFLFENGAQNMPDEGTKSSPKKRKPPPCALRQCPTTFRVRPKLCNCSKMLDFPIPRPRTPSVNGGREESGIS